MSFSSQWRPLRVVILAAVAAASGGVRAEVEYVGQVKPLLRERCYACHGALKQEGGLRLDTARMILRGGDSGAAVIPGDAAGSLLVARVMAGDEDERMPPEHEGELFNPGQVQVLRDWIDAGAVAPSDERPEADPQDHWAFRPLARPPVPTGDGLSGGHPVDAFIEAQHRAHGIVPQPEASPEVVWRRLYFDLVGLPPGLDELEEAARGGKEDQRAEYKTAVNRLLADPRHGERWGRHWMDVWRYSDWWGLGDQLRNSQKHMWHWRDWIVESLNDDLSYAEMVRLMLAADELHPGDMTKLRATGFLARNFFLFNRHPWMEETVEHVSKGLMGLTVNCAKCHDHKYDPVSQLDYYRIRAFFEPYQVRLDMVPGEVDFERDGVPRVYDGLLDEPTWRFIRGDEARPDRTTVMAPGVPSILALGELVVRPVVLPPVAWQPERQPWVIDAHVAAARGQLVAAERALLTAEEEAARAQQQLSEVEATSAVVSDVAAAPVAGVMTEAFASMDSERWSLLGGEWSLTPGRLEQKRDGPVTAALRFLEPVPRDFDVTLRFTTLGGSQWRSVGLAFDGPDRPVEEPLTPEESEISVYASAFAGGPKVQAAFRRGTESQYPGDGAAPRPVTAGQEHRLRVQVRDTLVNVFFDGEPVLAWRSPLPRRPGCLQFTTFDALAVFHEITIAPLAEDLRLREPSEPVPPASTLAGARAQQAAAAARLQTAAQAAVVAVARVRSIEARGEAMRVRWNESDDEVAGLPPVAAAAVVAGRELEAAQAQLAVYEKEERLLTAAPEQKEAVDKELREARDALDRAAAAVHEPVAADASWAGLVGARWTPTRFRNSSADDPDVPFPQVSTGRRTALAEWITDPRHPLTARVAVNHLWARHMGQPLVATLFDFGRKGAAPTHPELLDWLAVEFIESGWSMKHLHRLIVTSAAYRRSSSVAGAESSLAVDPDNRHLWRRTPVRLDAEVVRDSILAHSGSLDLTMGGPPVLAAQQDTSLRRSLYFFHSNNERNMFLTTFDGPAAKECYQRDQSIVPQQALALSNSGLVHEASQRIAARLSRPVAGAADGPAAADAVVAGAVVDDLEFIRRAWMVLVAIHPGEAEVAACRRALAEWRRLEPSVSEVAVRAHLVWSLINHNDFVTQR